MVYMVGHSVATVLMVMEERIPCGMLGLITCRCSSRLDYNWNGSYRDEGIQNTKKLLYGNPLLDDLKIRFTRHT